MASAESVIGKPAIRRTQQDRPGLLLAAVVVLIHVRMSAATAGKVVPARFAECVRHVARCAALIALDPQVFGLKRSAAFEEAKRSFAAGRSVVDKVVPRKIVQVAVATGQKKASGDRVGIPGGLVAFRTFAVLVHESGAFRTEPVLLAFEEAEIVGGQEPAFDAAQPTRKRPDRNADNTLPAKTDRRCRPVWKGGMRRLSTCGPSSLRTAARSRASSIG